MYLNASVKIRNDSYQPEFNTPTIAILIAIVMLASRYLPKESLISTLYDFHEQEPSDLPPHQISTVR